MPSIKAIIEAKEILQNIKKDIEEGKYNILDIKDEILEMDKLIKNKQPTKKYSELDLISFASYRANFTGITKEGYKCIDECLKEWKEKYNIK